MYFNYTLELFEYFTVILRNRVGYHLIDRQRGADCIIIYSLFHILAIKTNYRGWSTSFQFSFQFFWNSVIGDNWFWLQGYEINYIYNNMLNFCCLPCLFCSFYCYFRWLNIYSRNITWYQTTGNLWSVDQFSLTINKYIYETNVSRSSFI